MDQRRFDSKKLYKLSKIIVITITIISIFLTVKLYDQVGNNKTLYYWQDYCEERKGSYSKLFNYTDCMGLGFEQISKQQDLMYKTFLVAVVLPILFFGGTWLYKYLFPLKEKEL